MDRRSILVIAGAITLAAVLAVGLVPGPSPSDGPAGPATDSADTRTYDSSFSGYDEEPVTLSERRTRQIEAELSPPASNVTRVRFSHLESAETLYLVPVRRSPAGLKRAVVYFDENDSVHRVDRDTLGRLVTVRSHGASLEFALFLVTNYYPVNPPHSVEVSLTADAYERSVEACPNVSAPPTKAAMTVHEDGRYVAHVNFKDTEDGEMVHARITTGLEDGYATNYTTLGPCGPVI